MYEGGMDCFGVGDIVNLHYAHEFPFWNYLPNDAWWLERGSEGIVVDNKTKIIIDEGPYTKELNNNEDETFILGGGT